ncbi:MAG: glycosyltransferase family 4 protein [Sedimenticola sp.]
MLTSTFPRWNGDHEPPFVFELTRRLTGYDVHVLAPHAPGIATREVMDGISIHRFRYAPAFLEHLAYEGGIPYKLRSRPWMALLLPLFLFVQLVSTVRLIQRIQPDAIHAHWLLPQGLIALVARWLTRSKARLIVTAHGADVHGLRSRFATMLKAWVIQKADEVTAVSQALANAVSTTAQGARKIHVMPMGVDLDQLFVPGKPRPRGQTLIFAGRLVEKKGVDCLLDAMPEILMDFPSCHLLIAGDGPNRKQLVSRAEELGISASVQFHGRYRNEELPQLYARADIAAFPFQVARDGDQEGLGLVTIEAMGCGLPVVVSNLPAVHDVIKHEENGLLCPTRDHSCLARAIKHLLSDEADALRIAKQGRQSVMLKFDWASVAAGYSDLLMGDEATTSSRNASSL